MSRILCVEDDHFIADMYAHALKKAGYDVTVISNGAEALNELKQTVYDVVLLDIMLPDKTGVEILNELRGPKGEGLPHTKIIVTTNFEEADEDRTKLEELADGYLIKAEVIPSKMVELVKQITG
jgi:DNA-binding response OmpR family regulator